MQLLGPGVLPHHCNLMHTDGMVTVTPHGPDADTFVDGQRVTETTVLRPGSTLQFGSAHVFKFVDPMYDQGGKKEPGAMMRSRHKSGWVSFRASVRRISTRLVFLLLATPARTGFASVDERERMRFGVGRQKER